MVTIRARRQQMAKATEHASERLRVSADAVKHLKCMRRTLPPHAGDCALSLIGAIQLIERELPPRVRALLARLAADDLRAIEAARGQIVRSRN